jgi:hypothetical protein
MLYLSIEYFITRKLRIMKLQIFTIITICLGSLTLGKAQTSKPERRPVSAQKNYPKYTFGPSFFLGFQGGFVSSGIEWGSSQIRPVELVNILLEDENQRSSTGLISTEKKPTYSHPTYTAELGFRSSFYQVFAYGGSGKFYIDPKPLSRYGIGGGLNIPIGTWLDIFGNIQMEYDNSMNGMNLITLKYDESLSPKKRAAAEELILCYKDPNCQGAGFVTSQTAQYWSFGTRLKKTFFRQKAAFYISGNYLQSFQKEGMESITALYLNGGMYFSF